MPVRPVLCLIAALTACGSSDPDTSARIRSAYPDFIPNRDSTTHYIDRGAVGSAILGITASPSMSRPGTSLLVVQSRAALEAPPL